MHTMSFYAKVEGKMKKITGPVPDDVHARITQLLEQAFSKAQEGHEAYTSHMTLLGELQRQARRYAYEHRGDLV